MRETKNIFCSSGFARVSALKIIVSLCFCALFFVSAVFAQSRLEDRAVSNVDINFTVPEKDTATLEELRLIVGDLAGQKYSAVRNRAILQLLYDTGRIASAQVEATETGSDSVNLRFVIRLKIRADRVIVKVGEEDGQNVTEDQILLRLNLLNPGTAVTEQTLRSNADLIQSYLRERGYYNADVTYRQEPIDGDANHVAVTFQVNPGAQARVENFAINIKGFDPAEVRDDLKLKPTEVFSQRTLEEDVERIRRALIKENYLAPVLEEPKYIFDPDKNTVSISLTGEVGPLVDVVVNAGDRKIGRRTRERTLPIIREGTLEQSAIIEGERRLRNYYQQRGYFFAEVESVCSVKPAFPADDAGAPQNETQELCAALVGADLAGKEVNVSYNVTANRRLKLVDIRIEGTDKLTYEDVSPVLDTRKASLIGLIPGLGYGRGYTSNEILEDDRRRLESVMRELGYRNARVSVRQGVTPEGDNLIITFVVEEGIPTRIENVAVTGNNEIPTARLEAELPILAGKNFSRAQARNGVRKLSELYAREGYYDARVSYSIVELPDTANQSEDRVKIVYTVDMEGKKVFVNRILIVGNEKTDREAILRAITLTPNDVLRSTDIFTSEQNLYATDAFRRVEIKPEPAGQRADGNRLTDIIINIEEQSPRVATFGGGYSTDEGAFGLFDIRHVNLFGNLWQGGARIRMSRLQQLIQLDFLNPRFIREGKNKFAPLSITAQYQRDSTITRFFRSALDRGTMGIVQRLDEENNPIDVFGAETAEPTLNRLTLAAETSRTINKETRSILFLRYRFEDVRLYNIESLLIADLLRPDRKVRTSGFITTFVRDTRQNCNRRQSLLEFIRRGELGDPCSYNASDPTKGSFLTVDYNVSLPALGANVGFNKFQANYQTYYTFGNLKKTTLAGRVIVGLASVFSKKDRFEEGQFQEFNDLLPISERFFGGGSTTLRGFEFEAAGPRVVVVPQGIFRDREGEIVSLTPFTVPLGGNALFITNLEARIPITNSFQVVPFYDGGNVFRRVGDIFKKSSEATNDVFLSNLQSRWTNTVGLGLRIKTPVGGSFAVDYGYLLKPPQFLIPQPNGENAIYRLRQGQLHFRFAQIF
jgi:outer membrane protein insertion porin family